mmetsp:Transcript_5423/g.13832  ORF Transcript_5423/g.13832 Transcript_5423/m.13832 type:complete len:223 (+) Transcript_5423:534-1202(+)
MQPTGSDTHVAESPPSPSPPPPLCPSRSPPGEPRSPSRQPASSPPQARPPPRCPHSGSCTASTASSQNCPSDMPSVRQRSPSPQCCGDMRAMPCPMVFRSPRMACRCCPRASRALELFRISLNCSRRPKMPENTSRCAQYTTSGPWGQCTLAASDTRPPRRGSEAVSIVPSSSQSTGSYLCRMVSTSDMSYLVRMALPCTPPPCDRSSRAEEYSSSNSHTKA